MKPFTVYLNEGNLGQDWFNQFLCSSWHVAPAVRTWWSSSTWYAVHRCKSRTIKLMPCLKVGRNQQEMLFCPFQCLLLGPGSPQSFSLSPRGIIFLVGFPWCALLCMNRSFLGCGYYYTKTMGLLGTWTPQSLARTGVGFCVDKQFCSMWRVVLWASQRVTLGHVHILFIDICATFTFRMA